MRKFLFALLMAITAAFLCLQSCQTKPAASSFQISSNADKALTLMGERDTFVVTTENYYELLSTVYQDCKTVQGKPSSMGYYPSTPFICDTLGHNLCLTAGTIIINNVIYDYVPMVCERAAVGKDVAVVKRYIYRSPEARAQAMLVQIELAHAKAKD